MKWLLSGNSGKLIFALMLSVLSYLFASALMFTSGYMISLAATIPLSVLALHIPSIFVRIFGIGKPPLQYAYRLNSHDWVLKMTSRLRLCLYDSLRKKTSVTQSREKTSRVLSMLTDDIGHAQDVVLRGVLPTALSCTIAIIIVVLAGALSPILGLALLLLLIIACLIVPVATASINTKMLRELKNRNDRLYDAITDNANGIADWVVSGRRKDFIDMQMSLFEEKSAIESRIRRHRRICALISQILFCLCILAIFIWAALTFAPAMQASDAFRNIGTPTDFVNWIANIAPMNSYAYPANWIAAFALCFFPLIEVFSQVELGVETLKQQRQSVDKLVSYMGSSAKLHIQDLETISHSSENGVNETPLEPNIEIDSLDFSYDNNRVLSDFNLSIQHGEKIAIVGKSGAGKTTLVSLIHGDLKPCAGTVAIGGEDACSYGENMHDVIGILGQFPYLFDMSLRENLRIAKPSAKDDELALALNLVGLAQTIDSLEDGLDTQMSENGMRFSGGERHRIALARLFLADQPIIMLDEPFANLDAQTEEDILDVLFNLFSNKTLIVITHHTANLNRFDRVISFDREQ